MDEHDQAATHTPDQMGDGVATLAPDGEHELRAAMRRMRESYIEGLRTLARLLESDPEVPLPVTDTVEWELFESDDAPTVTRYLMAAVGGEWSKRVSTEPADWAGVTFGTEMQGLSLRVTGYRIQYAHGEVVGHRHTERVITNPGGEPRSITVPVEEPVLRWHFDEPFAAMPDMD